MEGRVETEGYLGLVAASLADRRALCSVRDPVFREVGREMHRKMLKLLLWPLCVPSPP